jgi:hypothetical protein
LTGRAGHDEAEAEDSGAAAGAVVARLAAGACDRGRGDPGALRLDRVVGVIFLTAEFRSHVMLRDESESR